MRAICHTRPRSNTGFVGVTETAAGEGGSPCFTVTWRPAKHRRGHAVIYYGHGRSREEALKKAVELRAEKIAERAKREGMPLP